MQIDSLIANCLVITYLQISNTHVAEIQQQLIFYSVPLGAVLVYICVIKLSATITALVLFLKYLLPQTPHIFAADLGSNVKLMRLCNCTGHSCNASLFPHPAQVVALASTTTAPVIQIPYRTSGPLCLFNADQKKTTLRTYCHKAGSLTPLHTPQLQTAPEEEKEEVKARLMTNFWDTDSKPLMSSPGTYPSKGISPLPIRRTIKCRSSPWEHADRVAPPATYT